MARKVAMLERTTVATPTYLERHNVPWDLNALAGHRVVGLRSMTSGAVTPLQFTTSGDVRTVSLPSTLSVIGTESYLAGIRLGLGLAQVPLFHVRDELRSGSLVQVLPDLPPPSAPVWLLYHRSRQLSPRVRVFLDWAGRKFAHRLVGDGAPPASA